MLTSEVGCIRAQAIKQELDFLVCELICEVSGAELGFCDLDYPKLIRQKVSLPNFCGLCSQQLSELVRGLWSLQKEIRGLWQRTVKVVAPNNKGGGTFYIEEAGKSQRYRYVNYCAGSIGLQTPGKQCWNDCYHLKSPLISITFILSFSTSI